MSNVVIYTRQFCGYCSSAKRLLQSKGAEFVEHDGTFDPQIRAEMVVRSRGRNTFPQIFINERHIGGSDELHSLERQGELDTLLGQAGESAGG